MQSVIETWRFTAMTGAGTPPHRTNWTDFYERLRFDFLLLLCSSTHQTRGDGWCDNRNAFMTTSVIIIQQLWLTYIHVSFVFLWFLNLWQNLNNFVVFIRRRGCRGESCDCDMERIRFQKQKRHSKSIESKNTHLAWLDYNLAMTAQSLKW